MDDLASLDWNATTATGSKKNGGRSAFEYLSAAQTSSRVASPLPVQSPPPGSRSHTPQNGSSAPAVDAFSSLLGSAPVSGPSTQSMSMADRLKQGSTSSHSSGKSTPALNGKTDSAWDFDLLTPSAPVAVAPSKSASRAAAGVPALPVESQQDDDFFGLDSFAPSKPAQNGQISLSLADEEEDSLLGDLARPAPRRPEPSIRREPAQRLPASASSSRAPSPPPHVLGKLVEMGFGIGQARTALSATYHGEWNVQAAAEALMGAQEHDQRAQQVNQDAELAQQDREEQLRRQRQAEWRRPTKPRSEIGSRPDTPKSDAGGEGDLLAQASEIGLSVFNKANAYWQTGRKAVQKAVEERVAASQATSAASSSNASKRPKWMTAEVHDEDEPGVREALERVTAARPSQQQRSTPKPPPAPNLFHDDEEPSTSYAVAAPVPSQPSRPSAHRLKAEEPPSSYVSPHRRKAPQRSTPTPAAPPKPSRPTVSATPAQLAASESHRKKGNELFKLGRYGDAETSYSSALSALPEQHLQRVSLLTNRAQSRLHNGAHKAAAEDCTLALVLLSVDGNEAALFALSVPSESESAGKALGRRAKAYEASERWSAALADWSLAQRAGGEVLKGAGGARVVAEGATRCRHAIDPPPRPAVKPAAAAAARRPAVRTSGAAVAAVRQANAAADAEEAERLTLKDSVDERLTSWKGGKEANLRALIASLDTVLWDGFGWQKVGLHELVTENQLKIRYMKAIARLHPDKLKSSSTSLEQRMIANGVFSALNDAWNAHKPA